MYPFNVLHGSAAAGCVSISLHSHLHPVQRSMRGVLNMNCRKRRTSAASQSSRVGNATVDRDHMLATAREALYEHRRMGGVGSVAFPERRHPTWLKAQDC